MELPDVWGKVDMSILVGRWRWLKKVTTPLENLAKIEPPFQPHSLQHETADGLRRSKEMTLIRVWQAWLRESLEVRHANILRLRTLLCCYGIATETRDEAPEDKKHLAQSMLDMLVAYLQECWGMSEQEVVEAQENVDHAAKTKAEILAAGYMNNEWVSAPYEVGR